MPRADESLDRWWKWPGPKNLLSPACRGRPRNVPSCPLSAWLVAGGAGLPPQVLVWGPGGLRCLVVT
eukprot:14627593-Alexandrium_andersonii.AAC.1